ncbi:hypothetical protein LCI18_006250 [Fusarium solani-melongenae]|uniref:Uncharacterized protein n=1 Tax=Fusarium solani subsp. cucurbitae TaxID=2747967 RepID=A0ACD3Z293_FUSSC|nr:hypothetical protein LCI18_006250 [Fusarium solani-melongenae]
MSNKYTIIINNRTGSPQNYNLFSEKPDIVGVVRSSIWSNIYQVAEATPDGAIVQFEMWKRYYAIVGTWRGGEKAGAKVSITQTRGVTLGTKVGDDSNAPGTTLNMAVINGSSAWNNAYEIDTGNDFTLDVATERNFFIVLASSPDGASSLPTATFKPKPGNQYQIQPINTYYITYGGVFQVGELLDVAKLPKKPLAVDFTVRGPAVVINHNPDGKLVIAK